MRLVFEAAARRLNFLLEAEKLHVIQGAASRMIGRLEESLGVNQVFGIIGQM
jgi:DNA-binding transcriptional LysR family regulator